MIRVTKRLSSPLASSISLARVKCEGNDEKKKTAVGARLLADDNVKNEKARGLASYEGPNAFRPAKSESDNGAARLMTRNAFSSQPV